MCNTGCFLGKVIGSLEISAEEPHIPLYVARQQQSPVFIGELAMNTYGGCPGDSGYLTRHFAALLEASNCAVEDDQIGSVGGVSVAFTINSLDPAFFLQLLNQVLVERNLEFRR